MVAKNAIATRISATLSHDVHAYSDRIKFANEIMVNKARASNVYVMDWKNERKPVLLIF